MTGHSCRNLMPLRYDSLLQWQQNRFKAMMWLLYKIPANRGSPNVFSRLTAVCCMLLPHNPYRLPQHYKRYVCGASCSCKHRFLWISQIFSIGFVWFIWVQYTTDNLSGQLLGSLHRPVLIFQPLVNCRASDKQRWAVSETAYPLRELCSLYVSAYKSVFLGGFRRWRESILATQRNLDLHGSCCLPKYQTGVKNIPPKFYTLFVMSL